MERVCRPECGERKTIRLWILFRQAPMVGQGSGCDDVSVCGRGKGEPKTNERIRTIGGLVFAVGLVLGLIGYVGDAYSSSTATIVMLGFWFIGGALATLVFGPRK